MLLTAKQKEKPLDFDSCEVGRFDDYVRISLEQLGAKKPADDDFPAVIFCG